jgi:meso-butanediol dehydrogenase / (S,S)-butanediol dehydrogenase / diacetyl reductase
MRGLKDKRVLITGGASGIGAATAARFLEEGSRVCILDRDAEACERSRREFDAMAKSPLNPITGLNGAPNELGSSHPSKTALRPRSGQATVGAASGGEMKKSPLKPKSGLNGAPNFAGAIIADVTDLMQVEAAFAEAIRLMDGVDVVINNAGISIRHKFLEITPEEWDRVIAVNLTGVFYVAQTAARHMWERFSAGRFPAERFSAERGSGVILQTASTNGVMGYPHYADYNATKAGVIELTRSMALELAPRVRVCAVAPGYVLTPMQRAEYSDAMLEEVNQKIPLRRHAAPEEIAALFAYLASDDAAYATGHVYTLDGGETAGGLASR